MSQPATLKSMTTVQQAILADTSINEAARESVLDAIDEATVTYLPCGISARRLLRGNW